MLFMLENYLLELLIASLLELSLIQDPSIWQSQVLCAATLLSEDFECPNKISILKKGNLILTPYQRKRMLKTTKWVKVNQRNLKTMNFCNYSNKMINLKIKIMVKSNNPGTNLITGAHHSPMMCRNHHREQFNRMIQWVWVTDLQNYTDFCGRITAVSKNLT